MDLQKCKGLCLVAGVKHCPYRLNRNEHRLYMVVLDSNLLPLAQELLCLINLIACTILFTTSLNLNVTKERGGMTKAEDVLDANKEQQHTIEFVLRTTCV